MDVRCLYTLVNVYLLLDFVILFEPAPTCSSILKHKMSEIIRTDSGTVASFHLTSKISYTTVVLNKKGLTILFSES